MKVNGNYEEGIKLLKYKDEEELEALRDEVKALRRRVEAPEGKSRLRDGEKGGDKRGSMSSGNQASAVALEELYRRARTEVAAEAGAGYGRVSLEALYLLPAEFTNAYQRLFLRALRESPGRGGEPNPPAKRPARLLRKGEPNQRVVVRDEDGEIVGTREVEVLDRDPDRGGGKARAGGRRHRDHWTVRDEQALRLKGLVDRELLEIAEVISRAAGKSSRLNQSDANGVTPTCSGCRKFLKVTWKFCPRCGSSSDQER